MKLNKEKLQIIRDSISAQIEENQIMQSVASEVGGELTNHLAVVGHNLDKALEVTERQIRELGG